METYYDLNIDVYTKNDAPYEIWFCEDDIDMIGFNPYDVFSIQESLKDGETEFTYNVEDEREFVERNMYLRDGDVWTSFSAEVNVSRFGSDSLLMRVRTEARGYVPYSMVDCEVYDSREVEFSVSYSSFMDIQV